MQQLQPTVTILGDEATYGQQQIVGAVLDPQVKRLIISCMTRYGKTYFVAKALLLLIADTPITYNPRTERILIIAPTSDQTSIIRNYIASNIAKSKTLSNLVDHSKHTGPEHLKSEMSKKRITFKNGWEIITLTAYAGENEADPAPNLMGWGGKIIVLDDADLMRRAVYTSRISRMLGDDAENAKLISIVNPWDITNFTHDLSLDPTCKQITINWQQALAEGRTTQTYLDEQKALLSDYEWTVLYESKWSAESEDTLIRYDWILRATKKQITFDGQTQTVRGLDVAEQGADLTILTEAQTDGNQYDVKLQKRIQAKETIPVAEEVEAQIPKIDIINVDSIGVGAGVYSHLKEQGYNVISVRVGEAPTQTTEAKRFLNLKSQRWWLLRKIFEEDRIHIPKDPILISQLSQMRYEFTSVSKIKIKDPEGKSPDFADSLMLTPIVKRPMEVLSAKIW